MELAYREFGDVSKAPMIVLHGMLGSSRNWQAAAEGLAEGFHVFCLDLRNHGSSPHAFPHSYDAMMEDVMEWMDQHGLESAHFLGHSMGGKLAMKLACERPDRVRKLIVVDIVPKTYPKSHDTKFEIMRAMDLEALPSRAEADRLLEAGVADWGTRQFLLTNLARNEEGSGFRWMVNVAALEENQRELEASPIGAEQSFEGEALFVMGGRSSYFDSLDLPLIERSFPNHTLEVLPESGHSPHFEAKDEFVSLVAKFAAPVEAR